jgi:hypothetical protein
MKIYKLSNVSNIQLDKYIKEIVDAEYGGADHATEGWCGEVAGDIYKYLKDRGESPEIWSVVDWNTPEKQPAIIENPTEEELQRVRDEIDGCMTHSFVKWNNLMWDGKGERTLKEILDQHAWGDLKSGTSLIREF